MSKYSYTIITPAYNEAQLLPIVIQSIVEQTELPYEWIIVDDCSTDNTWEVIIEAAKRYSFIRPVLLTGDKTRRLGANVVYVFDEGYSQLSKKDVDFIVKMDADSVLPERYFAELLSHFDADSNLGMASGKTFIFEEDAWIMERCPDMHVMGACKMYRHSCFKDIGGFIPILGWDKLDCAKARMEGWKTRSYANLPIYHLRQMGAAMGMVNTYITYGKSGYYLREHPLFIAGRSFYRAIERPYCSSLFMIVGYITALMKHEKRLEDLELAKFFRKEQLKRVFGASLKDERIISARINTHDVPFYLKKFKKKVSL